MRPTRKECSAELNSPGSGLDAAGLGDPTTLPLDFDSASASEIKNSLGNQFAKALAADRARSVERSGLVRLRSCISCRSASAPSRARLALADVREAVKREWQLTRRAEAVEKSYRNLLQRYTVTIEPSRLARDAGDSRFEAAAMSMRHLIYGIIGLCVLLGGAAATADEFRPGYLELRQQDAETWDVFWKVPAQGGRLRPDIEVVFPADTVNLSEPRGAFHAGACSERWRLRRPGGLDWPDGPHRRIALRMSPTCWCACNDPTAPVR